MKIEDKVLMNQSQSTSLIDFMERLSGGNHELFHSNLLAYLAQYEPEYFRNIFKDRDGNLLPEYDEEFVEREKDNLDLRIIDKNEIPLLIIENKMKSIPDKQQLIRYSNRNTNARRFLLLTLIMPLFAGSMPDKWELLTYGELAGRMENNLSKLQSTHPFLKEFLLAYIDYIKSQEKNISIDVIKDSKGEKIPVSFFKDNSLNNNKAKAKAFYLACARELGRRIDSSRVECYAGMAHSTPFFETFVSLKPEKNETEEKLYNKDRFDFWLQVQDNHISRGFAIGTKGAGEYKRGRKPKSERQEWLKNQWEKTLDKDIIKHINRKLKDETNGEVDLNEYMDNGSPFYAYVFDDFIMPSIRKQLDKNMTVDELLNKMAKELRIVISALDELKTNVNK